MLEAIKEPWPWYVAGPLIGLAVPVLLLFGNKSFGISSSLRHICAACPPTKAPFFYYDWKKETWNLFFAGGIVIGAIVAAQFLSTGHFPVGPLRFTGQADQRLTASQPDQVHEVPIGGHCRADRLLPPPSPPTVKNHPV